MTYGRRAKEILTSHVAIPEMCFEHLRVSCPPDHPRMAAAVRGPLGLITCESDEQAEKLAMELNDRARPKS